MRKLSVIVAFEGTFANCWRIENFARIKERVMSSENKFKVTLNFIKFVIEIIQTTTKCWRRWQSCPKVVESSITF